MLLPPATGYVERHGGRTPGAGGTPQPQPHVRAATAAALRSQLEEAVARIAEKERRVDELERRLRAREADVRMCVIAAAPRSPPHVM